MKDAKVDLESALLAVAGLRIDMTFNTLSHHFLPMKKQSASALAPKPQTDW